MSNISCTCSSNLTHFLPIQQEFVFFTRGERKGLRFLGWKIVHSIWSSIFKKCGIIILKLSFGGCFIKTPRFLHSENEKWLFGATKMKTSSCNIVHHPMIHMCAQYGHIIANYIAIIAITLVIWPEIQKTSIEIGHFVKVFLRLNEYTKSCIFPWNYVI